MRTHQTDFKMLDDRGAWVAGRITVHEKIIVSTRVIERPHARPTTMGETKVRSATRLKRHPHLSIAPHGRVFLDGDLIGIIGSVDTAWGDTFWGFRLANTSTGLYYVNGDKWVAARSCAIAYMRRRARSRQLRLGLTA